MNLLKGILASMVFAPSAWAASPFLPISATNTFASAERIAVEAAISQAETEGKLVLIDMAAAWCGPCAALEKSEEEKKDLLAPIMSKVVMLKFDEMWLQGIAGADFLPSEIHWFPSLFIYDPAAKKWTLIQANTAEQLRDGIQSYLDHPQLAAYLVGKVNAKIAAGEQVGVGDVYEAIAPLVYEGTGDEILNFTTGFLKAMTAHPEKFSVTVPDLESVLNDFYVNAIESNKLTYDKIKTADPTAFPDMDKTPSLYGRIFFRAPLGYLVRTQGNKAASNQCAALAADAGARQKTGTGSLEAKYQNARDLQCLLLQVQLKEKIGADVLAYEATIADADRAGFFQELTKTFAATGTNFDQATAYEKVWKNKYETALAKYPELLARVQKATDARLAAYAAGKSHP